MSDVVRFDARSLKTRDGEGRGPDSKGPDSEELPEGIPCPFCDGTDTEPASHFGSLLMTAHYYCRACRSTFDWARDEADA